MHQKENQYFHCQTLNEKFNKIRYNFQSQTIFTIQSKAEQNNSPLSYRPFFDKVMFSIDVDKLNKRRIYQ